MSLSSEAAIQPNASEPGVTSIVAIVDGVDDSGASWQEIAEVFSYSSNGIGFHIPRPCRVGNLVSLRLQLPHHLRCYDHDEELYQVWALVQICYMSITSELAAYQVVVALTGAKAPASYANDPMQNYRICGSNEDGLWNITESDTRFVQRRDVRYWEEIEVYLAMVDDRGNTTGGERTRTENVSTNGAAVLTTLDLKIGQQVKVISEEFDFSGLAVICNTQPFKGSYAKLHLQFVESKFPVQKLKRKESNRNSSHALSEV